MATQSDISGVREAFAALARSLKRVSVYRHARDQHAQYMEPALVELRLLLEQRQSVSVGVEPTALVYEGETVHTEPARETGLCFRLHRDGVRSLTFRRGIGVEELLAFAQVALPETAEGGREDAVTELWKADLKSIDYSAIAGYRMDEAAGESASSSVAEIAARAQGVLDKYVGETFAEPTQQPLLWSELQRQKRDTGDWTELARRAALTIVRIVEQDYAGWDLEALEESFWRLLDQMLERGITQPIAQALDRVRKMAGSHAGEFRTAISRHLADPARLESVVRQTTGLEKPPLLATWGALVPPDAGAQLLNVVMLGRDPVMRGQLAVAALQRLESCRAQLEDLLKRGAVAEVQALLAAFAPLQPARRAELASIALANPDVNVKLEAVPLVAGDPPTAVRQLGPALQSPARSLRLAAAQVLGDCVTLADAASGELITIMSRPPFAKADKEERGAFYRALGKLASPRGFAFLTDRLDQPRRKIFRRRHVLEEKLLAVQGLAEDGSPKALKALEEALLASRGHPPSVVAAARAAAQHVRAAKKDAPK